MPLSWSMDHIGPMAWTVRDVAILLQVIAGRDRADETSSRHVVPDYLARLEEGVAGVRGGIPENYFFQGGDAGNAPGGRQTGRVLEGLGGHVSQNKPPHPPENLGHATACTRPE